MTQEPKDPLHDPRFSGRILGPDGQEFDIPPEGSLGVLALGAAGLLAWRKKRGKIESSFIQAEPPKKGAAGKADGKGQKKRSTARRTPKDKPGKEAHEPQAGQ
jgi:hypothetical protein